MHFFLGALKVNSSDCNANLSYIFFFDIFRDDYFRMKLQWTTIRSEQENRFSLFRERKQLIGKLISLVIFVFSKCSFRAAYQLVLTLILHAFLSSVDFFKINFFEKFFHEYHQSVKLFGSRSCPTFCRA